MNLLSNPQKLQQFNGAYREMKRSFVPRTPWIFGTHWSVGPFGMQKRRARHLDHRTYAGFRFRHRSADAPQGVSVLAEQERAIPRRHISYRC